jgi:hypothetical protein
VANLKPLLQSPDLALLGELDGQTYHTLEVVVQRTEGASTVYCLLRDWEKSKAGRLIYDQQIIQSQQEQIELINQQLQHALREVRRLTLASKECQCEDCTAHRTRLNAHVALQRPITSIEDRICRDAFDGDSIWPEVA